jgi:hypothetical protein
VGIVRGTVDVTAPVVGVPPAVVGVPPAVVEVPPAVVEVPPAVVVEAASILMPPPEQPAVPRAIPSRQTTTRPLIVTPT